MGAEREGGCLGQVLDVKGEEGLFMSTHWKDPSVQKAGGRTATNTSNMPHG